MLVSLRPAVRSRQIRSLRPRVRQHLQIRRTLALFLIQRAGRYTGPRHIHQVAGARARAPRRRDRHRPWLTVLTQPTPLPSTASSGTQIRA